MPQQLVINVDDPADVLTGYGAGAKVRIERADVEGGPYAEITTLTVVDGTTQYEHWDAGGDNGDWYRTRYTRSDGTTPSTYSDPFQAGAPQTYADLDSLREYLNLPDDSQDNLLSDLLEDATDWLTTACERSFFRVPAVTGTTTRTYNSTGEGYVVDDFVSVTSVSYATGSGESLTALTGTDWYLEPSSPKTGWPYTALYLSDAGTISTFYSGYRTVSVTGVFGWPSIPGPIRKACLDLAREWYRQGPGGGGPIGVNQFGTPIFGGGVPGSVSQAVEMFRRHSFMFV